MKLPTHVLLVLVTACEPAHQTEPSCESKLAPVAVEEDRAPVDEPARMTPMAAPRFAQPVPQQTQPSPRPLPQQQIKPKPQPRVISASSCGHTVLVHPGELIKACGRG
jgi:hypothetical protein